MLAAGEFSRAFRATASPGRPPICVAERVEVGDGGLVEFGAAAVELRSPPERRHPTPCGSGVVFQLFFLHGVREAFDLACRKARAAVPDQSPTTRQRGASREIVSSLLAP